jgi:RsiW-degrading membrane proteinase PrsW (M82 family)
MQNWKVSPGWYPDPWREYAWRWWDGTAWTMHGSSITKSKPHLQNWVSPLIIVGIIFIALTLVGEIFMSPLGIVGITLGLLPLIIVIPFLIWLDRVEPEPKGSLIHALLWGGTISILVAGVINEIVSYSFGEVAAMVLSAPLVEEAMKGCALLFCLKRNQIDGPQDGIIYAVWAALGFAVIENILYFGAAIVDGTLTEVFISRSALLVFAHPMFTLFIGLFLGLAIMRRKNLVLYGLVGYLIAVTLHATWNGAIVLTEATQFIEIQIIQLGMFFILFIVVLTVLLVVRAQTKERFIRLVPLMITKYGLTQYEYTTFRSWGNLIRERSKVPRKERWRFDNLHAAIARLALLQDRAGGIDPVKEKILVDNLNSARLGSL